MGPERGTILVLGANSPIAVSCLKVLAARGYGLYLCARSLDKALQAKAELAAAGFSQAVRGTEAFTLPASFEDCKALLYRVPELTGLFTAVGLYGLSDDLECDPAAEAQVVAVNFTAQLPLINMTAQRLPPGGLIIAVGSVAGVRGRASNYAYGAAKAGLAAYLEGLRQRLYPQVRVIELRPGLIDTKMLEGRKLPRCLIAPPAAVGRGLERALYFHLDVVYCPAYWRLIMGALQLLPNVLYKRLKL